MNMNIVDMFGSIMYRQAPSRENCGHIEISGAFTGDIKNGMNVFVAPSGHIKGNIKTRALIIAGKVQGNVETYSLVIHSSGELIYNKLVYRELLVEDGGRMICRNEAPGRRKEPAVSRAPVSGAPEIVLPEAESAKTEPVKPEMQPAVQEIVPEEAPSETPAAEQTLPPAPAVEKAPQQAPAADSSFKTHTAAENLPQTPAAPPVPAPSEPQPASPPTAAHHAGSDKGVHFQSSF